MPQQEFDKSGKWLLQNRGKAILFLGGARQVRSCRALQAEVVQPRRLPDGLLEVRYQGREGPHYVLVEVATYPEKRVPKQVVDNMMLVLQTRGVLPDVLTLVLCPRGRYRVPEAQTMQSALGWAEASFKWKVVELWGLSAEELLAAEDVGLVPWVPLAQFEGPPEALLRRCRERIDREGGTARKLPGGHPGAGGTEVSAAGVAGSFGRGTGHDRVAGDERIRGEDRAGNTGSGHRGGAKGPIREGGQPGRGPGPPVRQRRATRATPPFCRGLSQRRGVSGSPTE